jgi:hypothetical protein
MQCTANMAVPYQPKILIVLSLLIIMPGVCSTHILLEYSLPVEPKEAKTVNTQQQYFDYANFFICLQHQYIGATWLVAPMYWFIRKGSDMFAAHCLVVRTLPISWRERIRKYVFPRWQKNIKRKENLSSRSHTSTSFPIPLITHQSLP